MPDIVEIARKMAGLDKAVWDEFRNIDFKDLGFYSEQEKCPFFSFFKFNKIPLATMLKTVNRGAKVNDREFS